MGALTAEARQFRDLFSQVIPFTGTGTLTATAGSETTVSISVPGAALGDIVIVGVAGDLADATISANVNVVNTVEVTLANATGSTVTLASVTINGVVLKPSATITTA